jgi:hypothetical protein
MVEYYLHVKLHLRYIFQIVQKQTTKAYGRILPTCEATFEISFSDSSETNHNLSLW